MDCPSCERINTYFFPETTLWINAVIEHSLDKLTSILERHDALNVVRLDQTTLRATVSRDRLDTFGNELASCVGPEELTQLKILATPSEQEPSVTEFGRQLDGQGFLRRLGAEWVEQALKEERYETWFKPIVRALADNHFEPFGFAASFRVKNLAGVMLPPRDAFGAVEGTELLFTLDLTARRNAVQTAGRAQLAGKLFINFHPTSIYDPDYCLKATAVTVKEHGLSPENIVFELDPSLGLTSDAHILRIAEFYQSHGFGVALGRLDLADNAARILNAVKPTFAAFSPSVLRGISDDFMKQAQVENLMDIVHLIDSTPLAVGVQHDADIEWLRESGIELFFGARFGDAIPVSANPA